MLILSLFFLPIAVPASAADWSVWDSHQPHAFTDATPPKRNTNVLPTWTMGRQWLPNLSSQKGRLRYIGDMSVTAGACIEGGDPSFTAVDLNELQRLWTQNSRGLTDEQIWPVYYGLMHRYEGGGTPISNASCRWAKAWLIEDARRLEVPEGTATALAP
jgi:hypothetical protein